jgi:hypothetical protein
MAPARSTLPPFGPTLLTWLLPGAGHVLLGAYGTAALAFVLVQGLYVAGFLLSDGQAFEFLHWELRSRFALVLAPEIGNAGALLAHQILAPLASPPPLVPPEPVTAGVHLGSWLTAASGVLNMVLMAHAHLLARASRENERAVNAVARAVAAGLILPGLGHWLQGRRLRGAIVAAIVAALFFLGIHWAAGTSLSREHHFYYWSGQMFTGALAFVSELVRGHPPLASVPDHVDVGIFYACLAGLLNALLAIDVYAWGEARVLGVDPVEDRRRLAERRRARKEKNKGAAPAPSAARKHLVAPAAGTAPDATGTPASGTAGEVR